METTVRRDATRAEIGAALGGVKFSLRRVSFMDLARGDAYVLKIERPDLYHVAVDRVKAEFTWKGCRIIGGA